MPEGNCASCRYYSHFAGICLYTGSRFCGRYVPPAEVCDEYAAEEDEDDRTDN